MRLSEHAWISARSIKLLLSLSKTNFICLVLSSIIRAVLPYVPIYYSARLIDALYADAPLNVLVRYVVFTVGMVFSLSLLNTYLSAKRSIATNEMYRNHDWMFSEKAMQMAYESIEDRDVAILRDRIRMESQTGYNLYYLYTSTEKLIHNTMQIILSLSLTISFFYIEAISVLMKIALVGGVILTVIVGILTTTKMEKMQSEYFESCVDVNTFFGKYYSYLGNYENGKDIRIYGMADGLSDFSFCMFHEFAEKEIRMSMKKVAVKLGGTAMNHLLKFGTYMLLIYAAVLGNITVGSIAQYVSCIMLMLTAISGVVSNLQLALVNNKYLKNFFSYFDIPNNMYQGSLTVEKRDDNEYYVEFRDVSFKYPNTDTYALRHVNLKFQVGEKLAVVGMNGSGKTTFIKLMCRLYDPTEGEILLNGVNISKYDYDEYMSIFSVVFQDFRLFSFRLGQNVATSTSYDSAKAKACLEKAGFGERLATMPDGLETCLYKDFHKDGVEISGGEAQKIALARALYKDAPFIILDEPTAALDPISEYEVYSKFNEIAGEKTAIYISHRLASCRFCDKIAVFHEGAVIQQGTHEELIKDASGKYYELWNAQAQYYIAKDA